MEEDLSSKKQLETRRLNTNAQFTRCTGCECGRGVQFRKRIKEGKAVTSNLLAGTWQAALLISEFVGSEVTTKNL